MTQLAHLSSDAVVSYVDRELPLSASERAAQHIAACAECSAAVDRVRRDKQTLGAFTPDVPDALLRRLGTIPTGVSACPLHHGRRGDTGSDAAMRLRRGVSGAIVGVAAGMIALAGVVAASQSGATLPSGTTSPSPAPSANTDSTSMNSDLLAAVDLNAGQVPPAVRPQMMSVAARPHTVQALRVDVDRISMR